MNKISQTREELMDTKLDTIRYVIQPRNFCLYKKESLVILHNSILQVRNTKMIEYGRKITGFVAIPIIYFQQFFLVIRYHLVLFK